MTGKVVIGVHVRWGIFYVLRRLGRNLFYKILRLLSQSIAIDEQFLCGYRLVSDWPIQIDINELILLIEIN